MKTTLTQKTFNINRQDTLVNIVSNEIRKHILNGDYKPGDLLPSQSELSRLFSVSVTVIREAIQVLKSEGIIEISQGKNARIRQIDTSAAIKIINTLIQQGHSSIDDLKEVRLVIESEIAALAAERASASDIEQLEAMFGRIISAQSVKEKFEADTNFHRMLARSTGNSLFVLLIDTLSGLLEESQIKSYVVGGFRLRYDSHAPVLTAIKSHNKDAARRSMIEHLLEPISKPPEI